MKLTLTRYAHGKDSTGGVLQVDGTFECFTCEDEWRVAKVPGETRIPAGTYYIRLRTAGTMTKRYAERYPSFHRGMLHLQDVPGFEYIYIHVGNDDDDTLGCILVGLVATHIDGENTIGRSSLAYQALYKKIVAAMDRGELVTIEIIDA